MNSIVRWIPPPNPGDEYSVGDFIAFFKIIAIINDDVIIDNFEKWNLRLQIPLSVFRCISRKRKTEKPPSQRDKQVVEGVSFRSSHSNPEVTKRIIHQVCFDEIDNSAHPADEEFLKLQAIAKKVIAEEMAKISNMNLNFFLHHTHIPKQPYIYAYPRYKNPNTRKSIPPWKKSK